MKCGGAIIPGALNSLTTRIALQQHPQHEHDAWLPVDRTFMIQVTRPCDSASRLISRRFCLEMRRMYPPSMAISAHLPIAVQTRSGLPHGWPLTCPEMRHWQLPTANVSNRSSTGWSLSEGRAAGWVPTARPTGRKRTIGNCRSWYSSK